MAFLKLSLYIKLGYNTVFLQFYTGIYIIASLWILLSNPTSALVLDNMVFLVHCFFVDVLVFLCITEFCKTKKITFAVWGR